MEGSQPTLVRPPVRYGWAVIGLFLIALVAALEYASAFIVPVLLAFILALILRPVVRYLARRHIPEFLTSVGLVLSVLFAAGMGFYFLSAPLSTLLTDLPRIANEIESKLIDFRTTSEHIQAVTEKIENLGRTDTPGPSEVQKVEMAQPGLLSSVAANAPDAAARGLFTLVLLLFLLSSGDLFLRQDRARDADIRRQEEGARHRARYRTRAVALSRHHHTDQYRTGTMCRSGALDDRDSQSDIVGCAGGCAEFRSVCRLADRNSAGRNDLARNDADIALRLARTACLSCPDDDRGTVRHAGSGRTAAGLEPGHAVPGNRVLGLAVGRGRDAVRGPADGGGENLLQPHRRSGDDFGFSVDGKYGRRRQAGRQARRACRSVTGNQPGAADNPDSQDGLRLRAPRTPWQISHGRSAKPAHRLRGSCHGPTQGCSVRSLP